MKWLLFLWALAGHASPIKKDEEVIFFPSIAHPAAESPSVWDCEVHGWIFELEDRGLFLRAFAKYLDLNYSGMSASERDLFQQRTRLFVADSQRSKLISVQVGNQMQRLQKSSENGHLLGRMLLSPSNDFPREVVRPGVQAVRFQAITRPGDLRRFEGKVLLLPNEGVSVISDIDDTIKISKVGQRKELLLNSFTRPFVPIPGMAEVYQQWARNTNCAFHYVSGSPWQLFVSLQEFCAVRGFPEGTFHLRNFDWRETASHKFYDPVAFKDGVLKPLFRKFPGRKFILVGDSGEKDPEIYGSLASEFPGQVLKIIIRDVEEKMDAKRQAAAFGKIGKNQYLMFTNATELLKLDIGFRAP